MSEAPLHVAHALCVYAESLAERRRVVVVGDSSLGLDARLVALGARTVHVYDPDAGRARANAPTAARGAVVRELPAGEFDVREGAFDLAIVPDLAAIEDRAGLLVRVRKLVGPDGAALIAAPSAAAQEGEDRVPSPAGLDYYDMYDLVALQFASVRMIGQLPFAGVALAELGEADEEPAVSVDTQLVPESGAPVAYIALAAQRDVRLEAYSIVQLPGALASEVQTEPPTRPDIEGDPETLASQHAELAAAVLRAGLLQNQIDEQRSLMTRLSADAERAGRVDELEAALTERTAKLKEAETRAGDHYVRAERLTHELKRFDEELHKQRDRAARLAKELDEEKKLRTRAEVDLAMMRKSPELAQARDRIGVLEEAVRAAEEAIPLLQQRAAEAERELVDRAAQTASLAGELGELRVYAAQPRVDPEVLAAMGARAERAEARASLLDAQLAEVAEAQGRELAELELLLRQRAQAMALFEQELARREGMVRELVAALEEAGGMDAQSSHSHAASEALEAMRADLHHARAENVELRAKLDGLALEVARREGELVAQTWRIAELEERVASLEARPEPPAERPTPEPTPSEPVHAGSTSPAQAELLALRQALTQEHEARVRAESGEELARARADLARQAVLLEQLARELDARDRASAEEPGQAPGPAQP